MPAPTASWRSSSFVESVPFIFSFGFSDQVPLRGDEPTRDFYAGSLLPSPSPHNLLLEFGDIPKALAAHSNDGPALDFGSDMAYKRVLGARLLAAETSVFPFCHALGAPHLSDSLLKGNPLGLPSSPCRLILGKDA